MLLAPGIATAPRRQPKKSYSRFFRRALAEEAEGAEMPDIPALTTPEQQRQKPEWDERRAKFVKGAAGVGMGTAILGALLQSPALAYAGGGIARGVEQGHLSNIAEHNRKMEAFLGEAQRLADQQAAVENQRRMAKFGLQSDLYAADVKQRHEDLQFRRERVAALEDRDAKRRSDRDAAELKQKYQREIQQMRNEGQLEVQKERNKGAVETQKERNKRATGGAGGITSVEREQRNLIAYRRQFQDMYDSQLANFMQAEAADTKEYLNSIDERLGWVDLPEDERRRRAVAGADSTGTGENDYFSVFDEDASVFDNLYQD